MAPCTAMSFTQWFTRSSPTVPCRPVRNATFNFVPTPSAELTSTGLRYPASWYIAPKLPISVSTPGVNVWRANFLMEETARSASSIFTPASR